MMGNYHVRFGEGFREKQVKLLALNLLYNARMAAPTSVWLTSACFPAPATRWP